ncbi:MAG: hypothetical protein ACYST6_17300, partial [Planctomycetota bacterium]
VFGQQLQGQLVTGTKTSGRFGHTGFVQAGFILGPFFGHNAMRNYFSGSSRGAQSEVDTFDSLLGVIK